MPNLITHALFAQEALEDVDVCHGRMHLAQVGGNGPDFLFFHGMSPKRFHRTSKLRGYGGRLHGGHVNEFYLAALQACRQEKNPDIRQDMIAYVCGHLCHWALDSTVHPYVFYRTGNCKGKSAWKHHKMESLIDAVMLKIKRNQSIEEFWFPYIALTDDREKRAVARVYKPALDAIFDTDVPAAQVAQSLDDWMFVQSVFYDPKEGKRTFLEGMEKVLGQENALSGYLVPDTIEDNYDVLNLLHKTWKHPQTGQESTMDFLQLYDLALEKARTACKLFLEAVENPDKTDDFLNFVDDDNYNMGTHTKLPMTYFDISEFAF